MHHPNLVSVIKGIVCGLGILTIALINLSIFFGLESHEHTEVFDPFRPNAEVGLVQGLSHVTRIRPFIFVL